ncbi:MAG: hypothetical protein KF770_18870 [Anaerolineae bacterium]|nr:hypothetical protein [Anaerolineae bacterium]
MGQRRLLAVVNRPVHLVNRKREMETISQAIFDEGDGCRLVLVEGAGGLGKTRLVEEVLRRLGHPETREIYRAPRPENDWSQRSPQVLISDLIDFTDVRLHTREYLLEKLADPLNWNGRIRFTHYAQAHARYQRLADFGVAFTMLQPAAVESEKAFWEDYRQAAQKQRLVIPMDTTEQLAIISSKWLLDRGLIRPEDTAFNTQQWLLDQIKAGSFANTTIIIAGRQEEGALFFDLLKQTAHQAQDKCELITVNLQPFKLADTRAYFDTIYEDWHEALAHEVDQETAVHIRKVLELLRADAERLEVLWLFTGGQPIRLALYLDVLVEGRTIPEPLLSPLPAARRAAANPETLTAIQKEIEAEFVQLLFSAEPDLRARILRSLARATRGLNAEQLHFILDSEPQQKVKEWQPNTRQLEAIRTELNDIGRLSIVKNKPGGRVGLQDEMYRIYAECMSANEADRQKEMISRQAAYRQMQTWADYLRQQLDEEDEVYVRDDLKRIHVERPSNILSTRMPTASAIEERRRNQAAAALLEAELEYLHYTLLIDPNVHFNDIYYNMANERLSTYQEAEVAMFQAEMWRILHDNNTFRFIDIPERPRYGGDPEPLPVILRRAAQTDDAAKWIIRFVLRKDYDRAIALANEIDVVVTQLTDTNEYHSWNHTLAYGERACWREYARLLKAEDIQQSVAILEETAKELEALVQADIHTVVFPDRKEYGFRGHPAEKRVILVLSLIYYNLGYVQTTLGEFEQGVQSYANSLRYIRQLRANQSKAREATVRNNLSRALGEMGKKRALRVCEDALELRIQVGEWLPIALSYNTLGLIMNDLYRPYEATQYCARALAIASRVGDERTIGLVLVQLGEALRRLVLFKIAPEDSPDEIYREAERALEQAREIFASLQESVRLIEANLETGCLYRNWMLITDRVQLPRIWERRYGDAVDYLLQAVQMAHERQLVRLELDARANLAWTHFYAQEWTAVSESLQLAEKLVPAAALLKVGQPPPRRDAAPSHFFKQLGKLYGLHGQMALKQFEAVVEKEKSRLYTAVDRAAFLKQKEALLTKAADAYVQALAYAELFIPRSDALVIMYDVLYSYLKRMNRHELQLFYQAERDASRKYNVRQIELENFGNLEGFLRDNFGDYYEPDTAVTPS